MTMKNYFSRICHWLDTPAFFNPLEVVVQADGITKNAVLDWAEYAVVGSGVSDIPQVGRIYASPETGVEPYHFLVAPIGANAAFVANLGKQEVHGWRGEGEFTLPGLKAADSFRDEFRATTMAKRNEMIGDYIRRVDSSGKAILLADESSGIYFPGAHNARSTRDSANIQICLAAR